MFSRSLCLGLFVFALTLAAIAVHGQATKDKLADEQKRLAEETLINNLILDARAQTTPEIAADALITIAESGRVRKPAVRRQILMEAFGLADQAQFQVYIRYMGWTDTPAFMTYAPLELKLDRLALKSRVVRALLKFDKPRAKKLFLDEMPPDIDLPSMGCENVIRYYDVSDYYETATLVFSQAFTPKERGAPTFFFQVLPFVDRITSPAQVHPVAKMLVDLKLKPTQLSMLGASYTQALQKIREDDGNFRMAAEYVYKIKEMINAVGDSKTGNRQQLLAAFRTYLLRQLNGVRCSDGLDKNTVNPLEAKYELPNYIGEVNREILTEKPILAAEIDPEKIVKSTIAPYYWDGSKKNVNRLDDLKRLRAHQTGEDEFKEYTDDEKTSADWLAEMDRYLLDFEMWQPEEEATFEDYLNKKSGLFMGIIDTLPKGSIRDRVFREYLLFLRRNELRGESRLQWFNWVRWIIKELVEPAKGEERAKIIEVLSSSVNSTMKLYADLLVLKDR